jgi:hypothetical protein
MAGTPTASTLTRNRSRNLIGQISPVSAWTQQSSFAFFMGGNTGSTESVIADKLTFSTSTVAAQTSSNLSTAGSNSASFSDCTSTYAYMLGGQTSGGYVKRGLRFTFSTQTSAANTASDLSTNTTFITTQGLSDKTTYGYSCGGYTASAYVNTGYRLTFSTSATAASTTSNLTEIGGFCMSLYGGATYGYYIGGYRNGAVSLKADRITFSTSTMAANTASNLPVAKYAGTSISDNVTYGYVLGGLTNTTPGRVATADRLTFSTGVTAANTVSNLSQARDSLATGVSDGTTYGYANGGTTGSDVATGDRITFSTGTTASNTTSNLSGIRRFSMGFADRSA